MVEQVLESEQQVVVPVGKPKAFKGTIAFSVNKDEFEAARKAYPSIVKPQELGVVAKQLLLAKVNELGGGSSGARAGIV